MIAYKSSQPAHQLLVLDIGNSATHVGIWSDQDIRVSVRVEKTDAARLRKTIRELWNSMNESKLALGCSVVPIRLKEIQDIITQETGTELLMIGKEIPVPMIIQIEKPSTVGMDRVCCAAAAYQIEKKACAVVDLGTAITIDCVNDAGVFIGGAILPGLALQAAALTDGTALLPHVSIEKPSQPLGQYTEMAICSGIFYGVVGAIRELVEQYATILGRWPTLFLTGGDALLIAESTTFIDRVAPNLCLRGVAWSYLKTFANHDS